MELGRLPIRITNYKGTCMHVRAFEALSSLEHWMNDMTIKRTRTQ